MTTSIRLIAEYYNTKTGEVIESQVLRNDKIKKPKTIKDLGYLHEEQIALIQSMQDIKLHHETVLLNQESACPKCGGQTKSNGTRRSNFHAALTDHKIKIQKRHCLCGWNSPDTIDGLYGSSSHPDLIEKQVIQEAENSYRQASRQLNAESKKHRSINNDDRIRRNVSRIAKLLEREKLKPVKEANENESAKELISVIDGGYLKSKASESHSFEAIIAIVFRPENIRKIDKNHNEISQKTSMTSTVSDHQKTIKQLVFNACRKEGSHAKVTQITCLTDGANNCWSIANLLKPCRKKLVNVLDWFHITKRFTILDHCEVRKSQMVFMAW